MKQLAFVFSLLFLFVSIAVTAQVKVYCMGHSLIDHAPSVTNTDPNTNILYWMNEMASTANHSFEAGGQYGFLTGGLGHDNLPPSANWGWSGITPVWDGDNESFAQADINTILITAANFIQYQPPNLAHPLNANSTALQATGTIFNWLNTEEPGMKYYIYGNWPEMNLANDFPPTPPTSSEITAFHNATLSGEFPDWWTTYQDGMMTSHPALNTRLIPVGKIISQMLTSTTLGLNNIAFADLYQDSAPHGRTSIYFLAGMITYMALYEADIPASYDPGAMVLSEIRNNLGALRAFAWAELNNFNFPNGDSRVFFAPLAVTWAEALSVRQSGQSALLSWSISHQVNNEKMLIEHSDDGSHFKEIHSIVGDGNLRDRKNFNFLHKTPSKLNYYRIKQIDFDGAHDYSNIVSYERYATVVKISPNPVQDVIKITTTQKNWAYVYNQLGVLMFQVMLSKGDNTLDVSHLKAGYYLLKTGGITQKIMKE